MKALPTAAPDLPEVEPAARRPKGFRASGSSAGITKTAAPDLGLVVVDGGRAAVAATFTTNRLPAAAVRMNRGILAAGHVRPTRAIDAAALRDLYAEAYDHEYFVEVVGSPPATSHVRGSNFARVFVHLDERTGRITTISVADNLVKGAAGQAIQAFNLVFDLPEWAGLEQLPLVP